MNSFFKVIATLWISARFSSTQTSGTISLLKVNNNAED